MSWLYVGLLVGAVAVLIAAEWPRLEHRIGARASRRRERERAQRKQEWKLLRTETEKFQASVERDLADLPTIEEKDRS